jgi:hypothetical protein
MKTFRLAVILLTLSSFLTGFAPIPNAQTVTSAPIVTVNSYTSDYNCALVYQKPADWTRMGRRQDFDAKWVVKNTGKKTWSTSGIDFKYISGTKMHTHASLYDLSKSTGPGKNITLIVDMNAPKTKGYYTETWGLYAGSRLFCRVSITVNVTR